MSMRSLRRFGRCNSGTAAIEFAIVGLVMIMMTIAVIEFGRALFVRNHISYASDAGTRAVLLSPPASHEALEAKAEDAIRDHYIGPRPEELVIEPAWETFSGVDYLRITVALPLTVFIPGNVATLTLTVDRRVPIL